MPNDDAGSEQSNHKPDAGNQFGHLFGVAHLMCPFARSHSVIILLTNAEILRSSSFAKRSTSSHVSFGRDTDFRIASFVARGIANYMGKAQRDARWCNLVLADLREGDYLDIRQG